MMSNKEIEKKLIEKLETEFPKSKGQTLMFCKKIDIAMNVAIFIAKKCAMAHTSETNVLFAVDDINDRNIMDVKAKSEFRNWECAGKVSYRVYTADYVMHRNMTESDYAGYRLIISVGINSDMDTLTSLVGNKAFHLVILTDYPEDDKLMNYLNSKLVPMDVKSVNVANYTFPVKEYRIGVRMSEEERSQYDEQSNFIKDSMLIMKDLGNIAKCRTGDKYHGVSANDYCRMIAEENGWNEQLNMLIPYEKELDRLYNPNSIRERASATYNVIQERRKLLANCNSKIGKILEIVKANKNKRILIVSYKCEFASMVANAVNDMFGRRVCGEYHNGILPKTVTTSNGKTKTVKARKQSTFAMQDYLMGIISMLSINGTADNRLSIPVDITIITSPFCENFVEMRRRFDGIAFTGEKNIVYRIYCDDTIELKKLSNEHHHSFVTLVGEDDFTVDYGENIDDLF